MAPWGYAAAGLGQGALEGFLAGAEMKERRRRAKMEQQREALMMLYPAIKQDPAAAKQLEPLFQQMLGPQFKMPDIKPPEQQEQQAITQRMEFLKQKMPWLNQRDLSLLSMGYAPPKPQPEQELVTVNTPAGPIRVKPEAALRYQQFMQPRTVYEAGPEGLQSLGKINPKDIVRKPWQPGGRGVGGGKGAVPKPEIPPMTPTAKRKQLMLIEKMKTGSDKERNEAREDFIKGGGTFGMDTAGMPIPIPDKLSLLPGAAVQGGGRKFVNKKTGQMIDEATYNAMRAAEEE